MNGRTLLGATALVALISGLQLSPVIRAPAAAQASYSQDQQLFDTRDLDSLVAPIALYPDSLLAQIFVASTYPDEVLEAQQLLSDNAGVSDAERAALTEDQPWDASVQALAAGFPSVIDKMATDFGWTRKLGDAVLAQNGDVLDAVQRQRRQAQSVGNLTSNQAQLVEEENDQIRIRPADSNVVYVPSYDPETAYSQRYTEPPVVQSPGMSTGTMLAAGAIGFGAGLLVDKVFGNDDDNNNKDKGWKQYWKQDDDKIDWRGRQMYVQPTAVDDQQPRAGRGEGRQRPAWTPSPERAKQARADLANPKVRGEAVAAPLAAPKPAAGKPQAKQAVAAPVVAAPKPAAEKPPAKQAAAPAAEPKASPPAAKPPASEAKQRPTPVTAEPPAAAPKPSPPADEPAAKPAKPAQPAAKKSGGAGSNVAAKPPAKGDQAPAKATAPGPKSNGKAAQPAPAKAQGKAAASSQPKAAGKCSTKEAKNSKACKNGNN